MQLKKTVVALGLAALTSSVYAQTNVQMYGIADAGLEYLSNVPVAGGQTTHTVGLQSGNIQTSRLGFQGTEDLGGGMKASFALESGFSLDTGTLNNGGRLWGRQAWVGIQNAWGQLQLGREVTTIYDFGVAFDPYSGMHYSGTVYDPAYAGRADNALKYLGKFGGLDVRGQYSFGYDGVKGIGEVPGAYKVGKEMGSYAAYDVGNYRIGAAYDRQNGATVATQNDKDVRSALGVSANFRPVKLLAAYERRRQDIGATHITSNLYWVGATVAASPAVSLAANLYFLDPQGANNRSTLLGLFASYAFSKRTDLYSMLALARNQSLATIGASGTVHPGDGQTGLVVGIRHRF